MTVHITMLSSLPPIIGLSPYTKGLVSELSKLIAVDFLGFNHIYPSFLYPGQITDPSATALEGHAQLRIRNVLNWYNPIQWIIEAWRIKTDIIHAQWWSFPLAPVYLTILGINKLRGKKIILTVHNIVPHERNVFKILLNKSVFALGDAYIVHTQRNQDELRPLVGNRPIHVIPHGLIVNPTRGVSQADARCQFNIHESDKILLYFGHIRNYKGLDIALKALARIMDPRVKLLIAGQCWEKWSKYDKIIRDNQLQNRVIAKMGFIKTQEIEPLFMASDLVVLPYKHFNAQSGVGALALPLGIPMIVSNTGGLGDLVRDEACLFEPNNEKELARKIERILQEPDLYQKLKTDLNETAKSLSFETIAQQTQKVYMT